MVALRRLLRPKILAPIIAQAETVLGPGWRVAVTGIEDPLPASPSPFAFPLRVETGPVGTLWLYPPLSGNAAPASEPDKVGPLLATCLESLLAGEVVRRSLASETLLKYREISLLHRATLGLNASLRPREVALALLRQCQGDDLPADVGMVFLRTAEAETYQSLGAFGPVAACGLDAVARSQLFADIVQSQKGEILNDLSRDGRWKGEATLQSLLLSPLVVAGQCAGMLALACFSSRRFEASHLQHVGTLASVAGIALGNALHFEGVQRLFSSLMQALATAIDARDPFTAGHSHRVARLGVALAKVVHDDRSFFPGVAFAPHDLEELLYAGMLHDVGKIGVREEVLTKATRLPRAQVDIIAYRLRLRAFLTGQEAASDIALVDRVNHVDVLSAADKEAISRLGGEQLRVGGRVAPLLTDEEVACLLIPRGNLTPAERHEIERHPAESYRILQHIPFPENMSRLLDIISQHHERLDGSGYPGGLQGDAILLQSRILAIVDIYDAITMARHYKPALPREKALGVLWQEADAGRIDSRLVQLLDTNIVGIESDCETLTSRTEFGEYLLRPQQGEHIC